MSSAAVVTRYPWRDSAPRSAPRSFLAAMTPVASAVAPLLARWRSLRCSLPVGSELPRLSSRVDAAASLERAAKRDLVGVLQVTAHRQAAGEAGHREAHRGDQPRQVGRGRLPLEVRVR